MNTTTITYVIIDSSTGAHLRAATEQEIAAFWAGQTDKRGIFIRPVRLSAAEAVVQDTGPGQAF